MSTKPLTLREQGLTALDVNWDAVVALVLFFASFALYARTAVPGVLDGDGGEFQTNIYLLGVSHTGYPLYFLLAKSWTLLMPVGSIAYRANLFSGLFGALTLVLLFFMLRTLGISKLLALVSSILFGVSRVQWSQALIPDVYTLNSFFIVLVLWLAILWRMGRVPLWWVALAYGLSLTHHRTMIWFAPALGIFVLWAGGRAVFQPRELGKTIAALFLPLLLYVYIPLRGDSFVGVEYHATNFRDMILASNVSVWLRFGPPGFLWERITQVYLPLLLEQFTPVGFAFGLVGIGALALNRAPREFPRPLTARQLLLLIGLAHLVETGFAIVFWVVDSEIFFIPSYLTFLFFVAIGLQVAWEGVDGTLRRALGTERTPFRSPTFRNGTPEQANGTLRRAFPTMVFGVITALLVVWCGFLLWTNFSRNDQSNNDEADVRWQEILKQPLEDKAMIVGPWEDLTPLEYYQNVEHVRTDLQERKVIVASDQLKLVSQGDVAGQVRDWLKKGTGVYFTRHPDDTETLHDLNTFELAPIASLWKVDRPVQDFKWSQTFGAGDELAQTSASTLKPQAGNFARVMLVWATDAPITKMRLMWTLRDASDTIWDKHETLPLGGREPAHGDQPNIGDPQGIFIPPDAPPGHYTVEISALERDSQNPMTIVRDNNSISIQFDVLAPVQAPDKTTPAEQIQIPYPLETTLADKKFLGYSVDHLQPAGGDLVGFSSWWQGIARADDAFEIKMRDANDVETTLYQGVLFPKMDGTFNPSQIVRARQEITIPPQAAAGYARLILSVNGQELPPLRIALQESLRKFREPVIPHPQIALMGDSMEMLGYNLERTQYHAGETIPLTLYWNASAMPSASYKVFVQLLDANGVLRAQKDSIPQDGALPTNRWFPGEYITDAYNVSLPNDIAAGDYHLFVGMYDEASGTRVTLKDAAGAHIPNDAVMLGDVITIR